MLDFTLTPTQQIRKNNFESPLTLTFIIINEIMLLMFFVILIINTLSQLYFKYILKIFYALAFRELGLK